MSLKETIEKESKKKLTVKQTILGWTVLILVGLSVYSACSSDTTETTTKTTEEVTQANEDATKSKDIYTEGAKLTEEKDIALFNFNAWKTRVDLIKKSVVSHWDLYWTQTFNGISQGKIDQYKAYDNLSQLTKLLEQYQKDFREIGEDEHIYDGIKGEQLDKLKQADEDYSTSVYTMKTACKKAKEMFDNGEYKPSTFEKIKKDVDMAIGFIAKAESEVNEVEKALSQK